jgi:hypothetical protein
MSGGVAVAFEERGVGALPKLYGAPAYQRRVVAAVAPVERPFDPDDLPLEAVRLDEDDATDLAEASTTSSAWADIVSVMASSSAASPYAAQAAAPLDEPAPIVAQVAPADLPDASAAASPAAVYPAAPIGPAEAPAKARLGRLFKGRRGSAS